MFLPLLALFITAVLCLNPVLRSRLDGSVEIVAPGLFVDGQDLLSEVREMSSMNSFITNFATEGTFTIVPDDWTTKLYVLPHNGTLTWKRIGNEVFALLVVTLTTSEAGKVFSLRLPASVFEPAGLPGGPGAGRVVSGSPASAPSISVTPAEIAIDAAHCCTRNAREWVFGFTYSIIALESVPWSYVSAVATGTTDVATATTDVDVAGMEITLPAGRWLIGYHMGVAVIGDGAMVGQQIIHARTYIAQGANDDAVPNTAAYVGTDRIKESNEDISFRLSAQQVVAPASETTYKVRIACTAQKGVNGRCYVSPATVTTLIPNPDTSHVIWALELGTSARVSKPSGWKKVPSSTGDLEFDGKIGIAGDFSSSPPADSLHIQTGGIRLGSSGSSLSVYREGSSNTITISGKNGNFTSIDYRNTELEYIQIGSSVSFNIIIGWNSASGGSGGLQIDLPAELTSRATFNTLMAMFPVQTHNINFPAGAVSLMGYTRGTSKIYFRFSYDDSFQTEALVDIVTNSGSPAHLRLSGTFFV